MAIGSPLFSDSVVHLGTGQVVHIVGHGAADDAPYVHSLRLDGRAYDATWIDWSRLANGATLEFTLGASTD